MGTRERNEQAGNEETDVRRVNGAHLERKGNDRKGKIERTSVQEETEQDPPDNIYARDREKRARRRLSTEQQRDT